MTPVPPFLLLAASLSIVLLSSFAAPAQARKRSVQKRPAAVRVIDEQALAALLKRDSVHVRPLLVNFWATWCDPCRDEFPDLVKIDQYYRPRGLEFIAVSLDDLADLKAGVPKFLRQMGATMPAYLLDVADPQGIINAVDPQWSGALPATFLYNSEGQIVYRHFGRIKPPELRAEIDKVMSVK